MAHVLWATGHFLNEIVMWAHHLLVSVLHLVSGGPRKTRRLSVCPEDKKSAIGRN